MANVTVFFLSWNNDYLQNSYLIYYLCSIIFEGVCVHCASISSENSHWALQKTLIKIVISNIFQECVDSPSKFSYVFVYLNTGICHTQWWCRKVECCFCCILLYVFSSSADSVGKTNPSIRELQSGRGIHG